MRITELSQRTIKPQNSIHTTNNAQIGSKNQLPALSQYKQKTGVKPVYYTPAFKGYVEDKEFISTAINMLDNAIDDVNSILYNTYETGINNDFLQALEGTKQNEELYEKITETPEIFDKIAKLGIPGVEMNELSMGMSESYEQAVECGATMVRVGSAIFGKRV